MAGPREHFLLEPLAHILTAIKNLDSAAKHHSSAHLRTVDGKVDERTYNGFRRCMRSSRSEA